MKNLSLRDILFYTTVVVGADQIVKQASLIQNTAFLRTWGSLQALAAAFLIGIIWILIILRPKKANQAISNFYLSLVFIAAAGTSNLLDQTLRGGVIDPFYIKNFTFNLADNIILASVAASLSILTAEKAKLWK